MTILIDGHNLIGQMSDLALDDPDDEAKLVGRLRVYRSAIREDIAVVFDGGEIASPPSTLSGAGVEVIFAEPRSPADPLIIRRIDRFPDPAHLTVVSSDAEIVTAARRRGARSVSARDFAAEMAATHGPKRRRPRSPRPEPALSKREVEEWLRLFGRKRSKDR